MKAKRSDIYISPYGGIPPILKKLKDFKIPELISSCLGPRAPQAKYGYEDVIMSLMMTIFCEGFRLIKIEDVEKELSIIPNLNIPSHDTIGRLLKKLATEPEVITSVNRKNPNDGEKEYIINENIILNDLLVLGAKKMGLLKSSISYTIDVDVTILESEVHDAKTTYKRFRGFSPMVCMINQIPVYISMRSGNANPHYKKLDCIKKCLELLRRHNIKVGRVRIDGAGYKNEILDYLDSQNIKFVIGANWSDRTQTKIMTSKNWVRKRFETSTHVWNAELASIDDFKLADSKKEYKMSVIRIRDDGRNKTNKPTKWHLKKGFYYKFVITNDLATPPYEVFKEYHARGTIEKNFDSLKNDFGWRILPFSKLNENLVYLLVTAFTSNIYHGLLNAFSKTIKQLSLSFRLEKFKKIFIKMRFSYTNEEYTFYRGNLDIAFEKLV